MSYKDEYLGQITPGEARETYNRAENDCEQMPSAAWRALHVIGQMHYRYAVQVADITGETRLVSSLHTTTKIEGEALWTAFPNTALADHWRATTTLEVHIVRRLMSDLEVAE